MFQENLTAKVQKLNSINCLTFDLKKLSRKTLVPEIIDVTHNHSHGFSPRFPTTTTFGEIFFEQLFHSPTLYTMVSAQFLRNFNLKIHNTLLWYSTLQTGCTNYGGTDYYIYTCTHCSVAHVARVTCAVKASDSVITLGILVTIIIHIQHTLVDVCLHGARENTFKYLVLLYWVYVTGPTRSPIPCTFLPQIYFE